MGAAVVGAAVVLLAATAMAQDDSITETVKLPGRASQAKTTSAGTAPAPKVRVQQQSDDVRGFRRAWRIESNIFGSCVLQRLPHALGREHTAGQELFLLASNFLLYTALVIVAIMISKLYLEADTTASPR